MAKDLFLNYGTDTGIEGLISLDKTCEMLDLDSILAGCKDISDMLVSLIEELKASVKESNELSRLLYSVFYDKYYPNEYKIALARRAKGSQFYASLQRAQLQNKVRKGDTFEVMVRFILSVFDIMRGCERSRVAFPANEFFLALINFSDDEIRARDRDIVKQQNSIITAFAADFHSILFVDLDRDTIDVYQAMGENDSWIMDTAEYGYEYYREKFAEKFIFSEDRDWFLAQTSPENIIRMLKDDPVFYIDHRIMKHGEPCPYQTQIVLDPMYSFGNKVLICGHSLYEERTGSPDPAFEKKLDAGIG